MLGLPWYAMELLHGSTLRHFFDMERREASRGALPSGTIRGLLILQRLCRALAFLHGEGLVHRDLKPENIWLRPGGLPVLTDFGIVSRFTGELSREQLELSGGTTGTLAYMAPEQIRGELCDARADLYSLGCILYELFTGRPPFVGRTPAQVLRQHLEADPRPPSCVVAGLPPEIETLTLRLLQKEREQRPGYADAVAAALSPALTSLGEQDGPVEGPQRPQTYLYRPRFVGREGPLGKLTRLLGRAEEGSGSVILLGGVSGAGKTRLLMELAALAQGRGLHVLIGEALPSRSTTPLGTLRRPLLELADRCRERGRSETDRLLGRRGRLLALYEPALSTLPRQEALPEELPVLPEPSLPTEEARLRLFQALLESFEGLTEPHAPHSAAVLLVLDDLHWADDLSLGFLSFLARNGRLADLRLLAVGAYRTEEAGVGPGPARSDLFANPAIDRLSLGHLEERSVGSMVADMLAIHEPPELFVRFLMRRSEGNAFFVAEYLRTAVASNVLYRGADGFWQVAEPGAEEATDEVFESLPLPGSVRNLVTRRLEGLGAGARRFAEAAAVLGRETNERLPARLGRMGRSRALEAVQELMAREVIEEAGRERLRFTHDQIRQAAYEAIPPARRRRLQRAAAVKLEQAATCEDPAVVGHHWEKGGEPEKAGHRYLEAAKTATSRYALVEAERLYRAGLSLVPQPGPEIIRARNELGYLVLFAQGRNEEAVAEISHALQQARASGDQDGEFRSLSGMAEIAWQLGRSDESQHSARQALELSRQRGDPRGIGAALYLIGKMEAEMGRPAEAAACFEQARKKSRQAGDRRNESSALVNLAILRGRQGRLPEAGNLLQEALDLQRETGDRDFEARSLSSLAGILARQGEIDEARSVGEQALQVHREVGNLHSEASILGNLGYLCRIQGRPEEARSFLEQGVSLAQRIGHKPVEGAALRELASLELQVTGDTGRAEELLLRAESVFAESGRRLERAACLSVRGHLELARGRPARSFLLQAEELVSADPEQWSDLMHTMSGLRRAIEAFEAGRALFRGELIEDLPEQLRGWLIGQGHLPAS